MNGPYAERLLDAPDVCRNCLRVIRVERVDPTRDGLTREYEEHYERHARNTEIAYGPADTASNAKGVFCDRCGTEGAYDRIWADEDVDDRRFRELVQQAIATLEWKGVSLSRQDFATHALAHRDKDASVDEALSMAADAAIVAEVASTDSGERKRA